MSSMMSDPDAQVAAPVRTALEFVLLRGAASFAVAAFAVVLPVVVPTAGLRVIGDLALPGVLVFVIVARALHVVLRHARIDGSRAWSRAAQVDHGEATIAAAVAVIVPVAWFVGLTAVLLRQSTEAVGLASAVMVWAPIGLFLWLGATMAWAEDCRERLALALAESDRRFRAYWSDLRATD